jgi:hypothetical protein
MKHASTPGAGSVGRAAVFVALAATSACMPKATHRQTDAMAKAGGITVSAAELRAMVNALADRFADQVEETADGIGARAKDPGVRRRALAFKIDAVPAVYTAAYRADPLAGLVDLWALAFQADQYLRDGAGRDSFGADQGVARDRARELVAEADVVARRAARPGEFDRARAEVEAWARDHPVRYTFSSRPSCATFAAERRSEGRDAFVTIGSVSDTVEAVSERLNTYAALEPKLVRWQAELLLSESAGERSLEAALGDVAALGSAARRAQEVLDHPPDLAGATSAARAVLAEERRDARVRDLGAPRGPRGLAGGAHRDAGGPEAGADRGPPGGGFDQDPCRGHRRRRPERGRGLRDLAAGRPSPGLPRHGGGARHCLVPAHRGTSPLGERRG